jgi:hypothetical protein
MIINETVNYCGDCLSRAVLGQYLDKDKIILTSEMPETTVTAWEDKSQPVRA